MRVAAHSNWALLLCILCGLLQIVGTGASYIILPRFDFFVGRFLFAALTIAFIVAEVSFLLVHRFSWASEPIIWYGLRFAVSVALGLLVFDEGVRGDWRPVRVFSLSIVSVVMFSALNLVYTGVIAVLVLRSWRRCR